MTGERRFNERDLLQGRRGVLLLIAFLVFFFLFFPAGIVLDMEHRPHLKQRVQFSCALGDDGCPYCSLHMGLGHSLREIIL